MIEILSKKYPHEIENIKFYSKYEIFWLYKFEASLTFNKIVLDNFYNTWDNGHPKKCPINNFIQQPTLF